jgi:hypothetical protein
MAGELEKQGSHRFKSKHLYIPIELVEAIE